MPTKEQIEPKVIWELRNKIHHKLVGNSLISLSTFFHGRLIIGLDGLGIFSSSCCACVLRCQGVPSSGDLFRLKRGDGAGMPSGTSASASSEAKTSLLSSACCSFSWSTTFINWSTFRVWVKPHNDFLSGLIIKIALNSLHQERLFHFRFCLNYTFVSDYQDGKQKTLLMI